MTEVNVRGKLTRKRIKDILNKRVLLGATVGILNIISEEFFVDIFNIVKCYISYHKVLLFNSTYCSAKALLFYSALSLAALMRLSIM